MKTSAEVSLLSSRAELEHWFSDLTWARHRARYLDVDLYTALVGCSGSTLFGTLVNPVVFAVLRFFRLLRRPGLYLFVELPLPVAADLRLESRDVPLSGEGDPLARHYSWSATSDERVRSYISEALLGVLVEARADYQLLMTDTCLRIGPIERRPQEDAGAIDHLVRVLPRPVREAQTPIAQGDPADRHEPVVLRRSTSRSEADLSRSLLEAAGVSCHWVGYESSPPWGVATPPRTMELVVAFKDREEADAILERGLSSSQLHFCHHCGATTNAGATSCPSCQAPLDSSGAI